MSGKLLLKMENGLFELPVEDVIYMEKNLRKIKLHANRRVIEFYGTFNDLKYLLDDRFMHCHRSFIINMDKIEKMERGMIYLRNREPIWLGRDTFSRAQKAFVAYSRKKYK